GLGGAGAGKSGHGEHLAASLPEPVSFVATASVDGDDDLAARIAAHRARRPASWTTIESGPDLPALLAATAGTVLLDALGPWLAAAPDLAVDAGALCDALMTRAGDTVVASEEVGLGVHPATAAGRRFRGALGGLNQAGAPGARRGALVVGRRAPRPPGPP